MQLLELRRQGTIGIVTRRVPRSPEAVDRVLATEPPLVGPFVTVSPFRRLPQRLASWGWRADLRLCWPRTALMREPVVIAEVAPWSATMTEVWLAPCAPHALHWGDRRWDRYFTAAHATADAVVGVLTAPAENWNVF
jgi:hypothetical protein